MTAGSQRAALDAIHAARPIVARLGMGRDGEDLAADLIEAWTVTETGLRSLVGGTSLSGQLLIRELRQRHFLSLEQANALAEFHAARERASHIDYKVTEGDVNSSREAFLKLEAGLMGEAGAPPPVPVASSQSARATAGAGAATAAAITPAAASITPRGPLDPGARARVEGAPPAVPAARARPNWLLPVLGATMLLVVAFLAWFAMRSRGSNNTSFANAVTAYREGRREAAAGEFMKAAKDDPNDPLPHVYLARMAREAGNINTANQEAVTAVRLGPTNGVALRELATVSFSQQNFDAARRFYIRAVQADSGDKLSQGFLGCSLVRLGRLEEGQKWIQRAGPGAWSSCVPAPGSGMAGQSVPAAAGALPLGPGAQNPR
jgi:Flp pilus assembly protein TadD